MDKMQCIYIVYTKTQLIVFKLHKSECHNSAWPSLCR